MKKHCFIHIIDSLTCGGAEILLKNMVNSLPHFHHIVIHLYNPDDLKNEFNMAEIICLDYTGILDAFKVMRKLRQLVLQKNPLLVHSHLQTATLFARLSVPRHIPLVSTLHSVYSIDAFKSKKAVWAERFTLRSRHTLIAVSQYVLDDYLSRVAFSGKRFVLYNFLPDYFFSNSRSLKNGTASFKCVAVGNLKEAKNYFYLLRVFALLSGKNISLDIYGDGHLQQKLEQEINREHLPVRLCGAVEDITAVLSQYDLFVQASEHEGFGLSVIEAIANHLPLFISDIPVFREITNGNAHFFSLDNPLEAAQRLQELSSNSELLKQYSEKAFSYAHENFNQRKYTNNLLRIYSEMTNDLLTVTNKV